jgi:hypothetical protein
MKVDVLKRYQLMRYICIDSNKEILCYGHGNDSFDIIPIFRDGLQ